MVEDSPDDEELVLHALRRSEYVPDHVRVETPGELRAALAGEPWDLILSDFSLPCFDGLAALAMCNELAGETPFVLVSGAIGEDRAVEVMRNGAQDYVLKNNLRRLGVAVDNALENARLRREARYTAERRREAEDLFRALFDSSLNLVYILDFEGRFIDANDSALALFGRHRDELGALQYSDLLRDPADLVRALDSLHHIQRTGHDSEVNEYALCGREGGTIWVELTGIQVDRDGVPLGVLFIGRDITDRKELQARLTQADRLSSMGTLAAGVAHEINNPLAYVLCNLESLSEDIPEVLSSGRRGFSRLLKRLPAQAAGDIPAGLSRLTNPSLIEDLRDRIMDALEGTYRIKEIARGLGTFSRVEEDQRTPVSLPQILEAALNMAFNEIKYRARVVKEYGRVPPVMASAGRLSQVFLNLLINAAHAIAEGGVEDNEIRLRAWEEDGQVCVEVRDTGCGIAPEQMERMFEPFFTTKAAGLGSGLGLPISRGIVEDHGGAISVQSEVGAGTSLTVRLPALTEEVTPAPRLQPENQAEMVRGRILVVDDEAAIRAVVSRMLREHETVLAEDGAAAMSILEQDQAFDLILCDMMMPEVSGMDLYAWLIDEYPELGRKVVFATGGAFTPRTREFLARIDNISIEKPFDVVNFKKLISELVRGSK